MRKFDPSSERVDFDDADAWQAWADTIQANGPDLTLCQLLRLTATGSFDGERADEEGEE